MSDWQANMAAAADSVADGGEAALAACHEAVVVAEQVGGETFPRLFDCDFPLPFGEECHPECPGFALEFIEAAKAPQTALEIFHGLSVNAKDMPVF